MAYEHTYDIPYFLIDPHRRLRATGLVQFLEDMAIRHSEACGVGLEYYYTNQVAWLLNKWDISVERYPHYAEQIRIVTRPTSFRRFLGYRTFEVFDPNGSLLAQGRSLWVYMNTQTRRPLPVDESIIQAYGLTSKDQSPVEMQSPERPETDPDNSPEDVNRQQPASWPTNMQEAASSDNLQAHAAGHSESSVGGHSDNPAARHSNRTYCARFKVHTGDLDSNRHVNNTRYVQWALDTLPVHLSDQFQPRRIRVDYKKETTLGQQVMCLADSRPLPIDTCSEASDHTISDVHSTKAPGIQTRHEIRNETGVACVASFDWYRS